MKRQKNLGIYTDGAKIATKTPILKNPRAPRLDKTSLFHRNIHGMYVNNVADGEITENGESEKTYNSE
jgi:hypothetical protein